jgi:hypothetical protein
LVTVSAATVALGALYLWRGVVRPVPLDANRYPRATAWLGLDRWAFLHAPWPWVFLVVAAVVGGAVARWPGWFRRAALLGTVALERIVARLVVSVVATAVFWALSSNHLNPDGIAFQRKFSDAAAAGQSFATHDELLELYGHFQLWRLTHWAWGWDVAQTYRATSCLAGGVAVLLALGLYRRFAPTRWPLVVAGLFAGGWVLVFFGDVENYSVTNLLVTAYLVAALGFLARDDARLWPVGCLLGVGALFHVETLALAPSLLVLALVACRRGRTSDALVALAAVPLLLIAALWWFDNHGLPLASLDGSHVSADGGNWARVLAPLSAEYFWLQLQLLLLLAPAVVLLPVLLCKGAYPRGRYALFLGSAAAGPLVLVAVWRAQLGQYDDWNLFAIAAPPLALLVWGALAGQARLGRQAPWLAAALVLMVTQTLAWVLEHQGPLSG